jgi:predicted MFS family arabinose efflux permease
MRRHLTLLLLTLIATVQFFDRALMVVVMEPLKREFALSDSQLGLLSGFSYAVAFALAGIPLGWLADRVNRQRLLVGLLAAWSGLVALCGQAGSFAALVATRVGIGATDAGGQPCSVSMLADLYARERRSGAVAVLYAGVPLGMAGGFMGGAMLTAHYGWRQAFLVAAALGALLTVLLVLVREPRRGASDGHTQAGALAAPSLADALRFMRSQASLLRLFAASVLVTMASSAMMSWIGSLLVRSHGLDLPAVGLLTAICMGGFGALGTLAFGWASDRLGAQDMGRQLQLMAIMALGIALCGAVVALAPSVAVVAIALAMFAACVAGLNGPTYALSQSLVGLRMRGLSMSVLIVLLNLVGVGVGPTLAGVLSDALAPRLGDESVRWAMLILLLSCLPAVLLFARAARSVRADLDRADLAHAC